MKIYIPLLTLTLFVMITILNIFSIFPFPIQATENGKFSINGIPVNEFTAKPLSINDSGDMTLLDEENFKFFYYPSDGFFFLALFKPLSYWDAIASITNYLGIEFKNVCRLPINISSTSNEEFQALCDAKDRFDLDKNGRVELADYNLIIDKLSIDSEPSQQFDMNFDGKNDSLDVSLLYTIIYTTND